MTGGKSLILPKALRSSDSLLSGRSVKIRSNLLLLFLSNSKASFSLLHLATELIVLLTFSNKIGVKKSIGRTQKENYKSNIVHIEFVLYNKLKFRIKLTS